MAHYALIDENNIVFNVITGIDENQVIDGITDWEQYYGNLHNCKCVRTSYNSNIRGIFAGVGFRYDPIKDVFYPPAPFPSWILGEDMKWHAPVEKPGENFIWDESELSWKEVQVD